MAGMEITELLAKGPGGGLSANWGTSATYTFLTSVPSSYYLPTDLIDYDWYTNFKSISLTYGQQAIDWVKELTNLNLTEVVQNTSSDPVGQITFGFAEMEKWGQSAFRNDLRG